MREINAVTAMEETSNNIEKAIRNAKKERVPRPSGGQVD